MERLGMCTRAVYVLCLVFVLMQAATAPAADLEGCKLYRKLAPSERDPLHRWLSEAGNPAADIRRTAQFIDVSHEGTLLNSDGFDGVTGLNNGGVWAMRDQSGNEVALKIVPLTAYAMYGKIPSGTRMDHPLLKERLLIHRRLSELDMAPRLLGFLSREQMRRVSDNYLTWHRASLNLRGEASVGLVMEKMDNAWSMVHDGVPLWLTTWSEARLKKAVAKIFRMEDTLNDLRVSADDPQLLIVPSGRVVLGDLDRYRMQLPHDVLNDFTPMALELIRHWERSTGKKASFKISDFAG